MIARIILAAALTVSAAAAAADSVTGTVLAFDRKANVLVLDDKSVFIIPKDSAQAPEGLKAGDKVTIEYPSEGEDGYSRIDEIRLEE